jgi:hypothetical protein
VCNYVVIRAGVYQLRVILDVYIYIYTVEPMLIH